MDPTPHFDSTITFGNLLTIAALLFGLLMNSLKTAIALRDAVAEVGKLKADINAVKVSLDQVAVLQEKIADSKERMDSLEERLRFVERQRVNIPGYEGPDRRKHEL